MPTDARRLRTCRAVLAAINLWVPLALAEGPLPVAPVAIGTTPQFLHDDYLVENRWALKPDEGEAVLRVFHPPAKHAKNPLITPPRVVPASAPQPGPSWFSVVRDDKTGMFRMWYQDNVPKPGIMPGSGVNVYDTCIAYAESPDGLTWSFPKLGVVEWRGSMENNVVWRGLSAQERASTQQIVTQIPDSARHGHQYVMMYLSHGLNVIGSSDGIHWDKTSNLKIHPMSSDFPNNVLYDADRKEFIMYTRAKHIFQTGAGDRLDQGDSRRIARMTSPELWSEWKGQPQVVLSPDELDYREGVSEFVSMTVQRYAGIYWGFLHLLKWHTDIYPELAFSRDGIRFERLPTRPKLLPLGEAGTWDGGIINTAYAWVEVGNEWWIYYDAWDGPYHPDENVRRGKWRTAGLGLAVLRKEGFISLRGPAHGGVVCTRPLIWPGGELLVNADAHGGGELKVRISDEQRRVIPGYDYAAGGAFAGNSTSHEITWKGQLTDSLKGKVIRLEFFLRDADLYSFRAGGQNTGLN